MSTPEALAAKLDSVKDGIIRLEASINRVNENINLTRHAMNGKMQSVYSAQDIMSDQIRDLNRNLQGVIEMAASYKAMREQASGGSTVFRFLWPLLLALASLVIGGGVVYVKVRQ